MMEEEHGEHFFTHSGFPCERLFTVERIHQCQEEAENHAWGLPNTDTPLVSRCDDLASRRSLGVREMFRSKLRPQRGSDEASPFGVRRAETIRVQCLPQKLRTQAFLEKTLGSCAQTCLDVESKEFL